MTEGKTPVKIHILYSICCKTMCKLFFIVVHTKHPLRRGVASPQIRRLGGYGGATRSNILHYLFLSFRRLLATIYISLVGFFIFIYAIPIFGQVIINEVMFNPLGDENRNEFIELYNSGNQPVNVNGWKISDSTGICIIKSAGFGTVLNPEQYALILDPDYFGMSTQYDSLIPQNALIMTIDHSAFGSRGLRNSPAEPVILISSAGDTLAVYRYTTNNADGISDEKIIPNTDDSTRNWSNSRVPNGTPGKRNSVTPPDYDVVLSQMTLEPVLPLLQQPVTVSAAVHNNGIFPPQTADILLYCDSNGDNVFSEGELIQSQELTASQFGGYRDSCIVRFYWMPLFSGSALLWATVQSNQDSITENNSISIPVNILQQANQVIINEIMNCPLNGKPEWIELYNRGSSEVNLQYWYFCDLAHRSGVLISAKKAVIPPNGYIILTWDASQFLLQYQSAVPVISVSGIQTINNDRESLWIVDPSNRMSDSLFFDSSWGALVGVSLERIKDAGASMLKSNWGLSADPQGATPGAVNSLNFSAGRDYAIDIIPEPNPFSPGYGTDCCIITVRLPFVQSVVTIKIFDRYGRLVRELVKGEPRGSIFTVRWNGTSDAGAAMLTGMYIIFCSAFSTDSGQKLEKKTTVVLVRR